MSSGDAYGRHGFVIHPEPVIPAGLVARAVEGMDAVREGRYDTGREPASNPYEAAEGITLGKIENPQFANRAIRELISHPALGEALAAATGAEMIQVWWVQLLYKPPTPAGETSKTQVGWHRDWTYWEPAWADGSELLTAWVAISDVDESCGPMRFVDGSHAWEGAGGGDFWSQDLEGDRGGFRLPAGESWSEVPVLVPAGGCSIHHKLTIHGSSLNRSGRPRRSFAVHVRTEKSRPRDGKREGLSKFVDELEVCPIIHGERVEAAF